MLKSEMRTCRELSFLSIERWMLRYKDTRQWFVKIYQTAGFLTIIALQRICWHAGRVKDWVHLHQNWRHLHPERLLCQLVTMRELNVQKSKVRLMDMCIFMLLLRMLNFQHWCICQGLQAWHRFYSRFADCWRNNHWLVHYLLHGNAANIHFADQSCLFNEPDSWEQHW